MPDQECLPRATAWNNGVSCLMRAWMTAQLPMRQSHEIRRVKFTTSPRVYRFHGASVAGPNAYSVVAVVVLKSRAMRDYVVV